MEKIGGSATQIHVENVMESIVNINRANAKEKHLEKAQTTRRLTQRRVRTRREQSATSEWQIPLLPSLMMMSMQQKARDPAMDTVPEWFGVEY